MSAYVEKLSEVVPRHGLSHSFLRQGGGGSTEWKGISVWQAGDPTAFNENKYLNKIEKGALSIFLFYLFFYTAGSHWLSILYILVYTCQSQSPNSSHHYHPEKGALSIFAIKE